MNRKIVLKILVMASYQVLARKSGSVEPQGTKRQRGDKHCKVHFWCGHEGAQCIVQQPELEAEWRRLNPDKAKVRDERIQKQRATRASASALAPPASAATMYARVAFSSISENKF
jgi:hypothetical protein